MAAESTATDRLHREVAPVDHEAKVLEPTLKLEVQQDHVFGDTVARYLIDPATGRVGLLLIPARCSIRSSRSLSGAEALQVSKGERS